jgi:hypothetical protein
VTSVEQGKAQEAIEIKSHATHFIHQDHFLVLNKCLENELRSWGPKTPHLQTIKESLSSKETDLKKQLQEAFPVVLEFPEIISISPHDHITSLTKEWTKYAQQS